MQPPEWGLLVDKFLDLSYKEVTLVTYIFFLDYIYSYVDGMPPPYFGSDVVASTLFSSIWRSYVNICIILYIYIYVLYHLVYMIR